jgi:hypothetical protein
LKENFPTTIETNQENEDDIDKEEHLAWKKYLMVNILIEICSRKSRFCF